MENEVDKGIEIDSDYYLIKVFNAINEDKTSKIFNGIIISKNQDMDLENRI